MGISADLRGQRFGKLKAIKIVPKPEGLIGRDTYWLCICDCGNEKIARSTFLVRQRTVSCGQCNYARECKTALIRNMIGKIIGRLTVIERIDNSKKGGNYLCNCSCGNRCERSGKLLRISEKSGAISSCGCYGLFIDLIGKRFGKLVVRKRGEDYISPQGHHSPQWLCQCDCGNLKIIAGNFLKNGDIKSCGCLSESYIASELKKYLKKDYEAIPEYKIFKNPETGYWLSYDIYLPNENIFIEVHGRQHYEINQWHKRQAKKNNTTPEEEFEYQKKKDRMKRKYARKNGTYIEIDLRKIKTIYKAIEHVEKIINKMR